jgi:hypothetical protein
MPGKCAQAVIKSYEMAREKRPDSLQELKRLVVAVSTSGVLQAHIRTIVEYNRQQAVAQAVPTQPGSKVP